MKYGIFNENLTKIDTNLNINGALSVQLWWTNSIWVMVFYSSGFIYFVEYKLKIAIGILDLVGLIFKLHIHNSLQ